MNIQEQSIIKCKIPPLQNVVYIKVLEFQEDENIFYCTNCINRNDSLKLPSLVVLEEVLNLTDNSQIYNWPPLNDRAIYKKFADLFEKSQKQNNNYILDAIIKNYQELRDQFNSSIDTQIKQLTKFFLDIPTLQQLYQQFSQGGNLNQIIFENIQYPEIIQQECKSFIQDFNSRKTENTIIFQRMIDYQNQILNIFDVNQFTKLQENIMQNLREIQQLTSNITGIKTPSSNGFLNILPSLEFVKSEMGLKEEQYQRMQKSNSQQIDFLSSRKAGFSPNQLYYYSNKILEKDKKYIFKFKISNLSNLRNIFGFGLCRDEIKNKGNLNDDNQFIHLCSKDDKILQTDYRTLSPYKIENLTNFYLKKQNGIKIELTIFIQEGIFELKAIDDKDQENKFQIALELEKTKINQVLRFYITIGGMVDIQMYQAIEI